MSQKITKYIEFLKNPSNYINNDKATCIAVNTLITETDAMLLFIDATSRHHVNSIFPQIKQVKCETNIASLLSNTQFTNINQLAQILVAKYLYIFNLLGANQQDQSTKAVNTNCDDIKMIVDNAVKSMSLDKVLSTNNLFTDKPINYKVDTVDTQQNLVSSFVKSLKPLLIFEERNLEDVTGRNANVNLINTIEIFDQKKKFADEITKIMNGDLLFNSKKQNIINNFQYLINKMFNDKILEYINSKGFKEDSILFVYKGGTTMKIIYDKYKSILTQNNKLFDDFEKFFSRSDADYSIFINMIYFNTFDSYNQVLCDVNRITFNILEKIQEILSNNLPCMCPIDNVTSADLKSLLASFNNILNTPDRDKTLPDFNDIQEFIGITFNNKDYFTKSVPVGLIDSDIHNLTIQSGKSHLSEFDINFVSKKTQLKQFGKIDSTRDDFIIKIQENNVPGKPKFSPSICKISRQPNRNGIYYYLNETNKFLGNGSLADFNLHRLKINAIIYYITKSGQYGYFNNPSELVDISIGNFYEDKLQGLDFNKIIKKYKNNKVEFYSYSIYGFIDDIYKGIFSETKYPWEAAKYEKKAYRVMILMFIYINNKFNNTKVLYDALNQFFIDLTNDKVGNIDMLPLEDKLTNRKTELKNELIIYKLYSNILSRYQLIKKETDPTIQISEMNNFKKMIKIFTDLLLIFKPENVNSGYNDNIEEVPFMDKYLKYKNKYFALLKKLGKI